MSAAVRVVLDTNVLVAIFVFSDSRLTPLWGEVESKRWVALTNGPCLAEFERVLGYPLFGLAMERQEAAYLAYRARAEAIDAMPQNAIALPRCRDRDDQKFLELARDGGAHWLITADKLLLKLRRGRRLGGLFHILTPDEALQKIGSGETASAAPWRQLLPSTLAMPPVSRQHHDISHPGKEVALIESCTLPASPSPQPLAPATPTRSPDPHRSRPNAPHLMSGLPPWPLPMSR